MLVFVEICEKFRMEIAYVIVCSKLGWRQENFLMFVRLSCRHTLVFNDSNILQGMINVQVNEPS